MRLTLPRTTKIRTTSPLKLARLLTIHTLAMTAHQVPLINHLPTTSNKQPTTRPRLHRRVTKLLGGQRLRSKLNQNPPEANEP